MTHATHSKPGSSKKQTTETFQLPTPPITPTSSHTGYSSSSPDVSESTVEDVHTPLWSHDDVVSTSYRSATFDVDVQPALIGIGTNCKGVIVAVHIQACPILQRNDDALN